MPLTDFESDLLHRDGVFMANYVYGLVAQSGLWGIYLIIFVFAAYCMLVRRMKTRAWFFMLVSAVFLFSLSTALFSIQLFQFAMQVAKIMFPPEDGTLDSRVTSISNVWTSTSYALLLIFSAQFLIGDGIVIWRTWVLWQGSWIVFFPIALWSAALGMLLAERVVFVRSGAYSQSMVTHDVSSVPRMSAACYALSLAANAVSTVLIAFKAWRYRQHLKESFIHPRRTAVERVFALLVESGLIYFAIWIITILTNLSPQFGTFEVFLQVWLNVSYQLVGLYPTAIIAVVELQRSMCDSMVVSSLPVTHSISLPLPHPEVGSRESISLDTMSDHLNVSETRERECSDERVAL